MSTNYQLSFVTLVLLLVTIGFSRCQTENAKCNIDGKPHEKFECRKSCGGFVSSLVGDCDAGLKCCYKPEAEKCKVAGKSNPKFVCRKTCGDSLPSLLGTCSDGLACCYESSPADILRYPVF